MFRPILLLLAVLGFALAGPARADDAINTTLFGHLAADGYDVVAYQTDDRAIKGKSEFRYAWHGANWQFASAEHLATFKADPQRYAPQYGGYCAYAVAKGDKVGIDPEAYSVVDGKLYLNYSKDIRGKWLERRDAYIEQADHNWPALSQQ
ncbi:YHS domain-containing (seleno)protein [Solimonas marina]|uniref:Tat pathway signal sequence domain protein n=1 Tax=Solimonas marina TaxID=2714601 RepID=A0A969WDJ9_9GAMM|nr:YHS domain-containing (seleno)protein [Solimonas marina]NKF24033.1 tat pathway signal sequence domain protein [Solimonas marina]